METSETSQPGWLTREGADTARAGARRPRRLRRTNAVRALVRETRLSVDDLVLPLFVTHDSRAHQVASMPGVFQWPVSEVGAEAERAAALGIGAVLLFGIPGVKDAAGSGAEAEDGIVQRAMHAIRERVPDLVIIADTCLCEYTDHGHCGILDDRLDMDNDATLAVLQRVAVSQAAAGADMVAPSGMVDGMVGAIRRALDDAGHEETAILSYSTKYASAFYGPFRDAAQGAPAFGDRRTHQMDPANAREALRENALDVAEGADLLMVKPALAYLDIVRQTRAQFPDLPLVAYNVSGEYAMVKAAAVAGWLDERSIVLETLTGMKRAGADLIITYHALDVARWIGH
ncbi:MAG: porphobilinogen synthase [Gemmatimonadetes bacterium]|nr:porphobilinogen synthase [Gemmatimonadota bacterium]